MRVVCRQLFGVSFAVMMSAASAAAQDMTVIKELIDLEELMANAIVRGDDVTLAQLVADNFLSMDENLGEPLNKSAVINSLKKSTNRIISLKHDGYQGQVFGETAIIVGVASESIQRGDRVLRFRAVWTDTWMKQGDGRWLCVASQSARLSR